MLEQPCRNVLVIGRIAFIGDGNHDAELVAGDDFATGIGHVKNLDCGTQVGGRHCLNRDVTGSNGIAPILVPRPCEGVAVGILE